MGYFAYSGIDKFLGVDFALIVTLKIRDNIEVVFIVGPAAKSESAVLLSPRPVFRVEVAKSSVSHWGQPHDLAIAE